MHRVFGYLIFGTFAALNLLYWPNPLNVLALGFNLGLLMAWTADDIRHWYN